MFKKFIALLSLFLMMPYNVYSQPVYSGPVNINITIMKASNGRDGIDPKLEPLASQLKRLNYTDYKFLQQDDKSGNLKDELRFDLPDGDVLRVTILNVSDPYIKLYVAMNNAGLNTNFQISNRGTVIVGGNRYKGGSLVIAITASF